MDHPGWTPVGNRTKSEQSQGIETLAQFVRQLTASVADVADADQWAATVAGVEDRARCSLRRLVPSWWLNVFDGGRPATHEVSLLLNTADRPLGEIQLESWKPGGFRQNEIDDARRAARSMARLVAMVLPPTGLTPTGSTQ